MLRHLRLALLALLLGAPLSASAQDAAEIVVRLNRAEGQLRQLSGQIEQLQFENRQLKEQVRKFQEDVEFRFQEARGGKAAAPAATSGPAAIPASPSPSRQPAPGRRGDAFDPGANPTAPGAPRALGTTPPSPPLTAAAPALSPEPPFPAPSTNVASSARPPIAADDDDDAPPPGGGPLDIHELGRLAEIGGAPGRTATALPPRAAPNVATTPTGDPRMDYEVAYAYLLQKQYEKAEMGFRQFIQSHPRDRLVADATFWLGETYLARSRPREAAEQYLKVSTDFARSSKAPDAMLKLGVSLQALGAHDQACATFAELARKFPDAGATVRQGVEREQKRARCTA